MLIITEGFVQIIPYAQKYAQDCQAILVIESISK